MKASILRSRSSFIRFCVSALGAVGFLGLFSATVSGQASQLVFSENFESGWNGWTNNTQYNTDPRHAWVVTTPTNGPSAAHGGTNCAATLNPGNDCYLVSPMIVLPVVNQYSNHVWLFYWQWQKYVSTASNSCLSDVKVRQLIPDPLGGYYWGPWNVIDPGTSGVIPMNSPAWRRRGIDLTLFSGVPVQLGFGHAGTGNPGWFVDDVEIWNVPVLPAWPGGESFENGWSGWQTDHGAWDIGVAAIGGPTNAPDGLCCAGTGLDGLVPTVVDAYLWTPAFYLPTLNPGEKAYLQFDQWYDYPTPFCAALSWSQWWSSIGWSWPQNIDPDVLTVTAYRRWTTLTKDITRLAGAPLPMRLGFSHFNLSGGGLGWFIDNVRVNVAHFRLAQPSRQGNDLALTWSAPAGTTNVLQCSGTVTGGFTNVSPSLIATGTAESITTFIHAGAGDNPAPKFYRVRRLP